MPFREIFEQVLKESEVRLNEDKRGKKMTEVPLKQHFLNSKFDDGRKMFDSPEDLIAATVRTASGKYGIVRSVSKELDAEGFPLKVVITADEDTPIKRGIEVSTEGMLAPREVRVATVDMDDETTKRVTGLINAGKSDDEIINDLFDPAQYQHSPENEQQVRDLLASVRSTLPKEEQSPSAKLLAQIKNRAVELGKVNNIPVEDYIKSLDRADFLASAYDDITDEELVDDIKFFNEEAQKPNEPEEEIKEPAEGEEIDWGKELGESKLNEIRYQVIIPGLNDMDSMKDQRETSASSEKQAVANIVSRLARNTKGLKYQGIEISPQNIGLLISKIQAKVTRLTESKINEVKCALCGKNTPITKDLEDSDRAICDQCEEEEKMRKLTVEGKTHDAYNKMKEQLKTEKDPVKRRQLQDEISDIEDHWKQTWEAKDPGMSFHYLVGSIKGLLQSWGMIEHMKNPLNYIRERLEALYKEMNESKKVNEALTDKGKETIKKWMSTMKSREVAIKMVDNALMKKMGLTSSELPDTSTFANGLDGIEEWLKEGNLDAAWDEAKETATLMFQDAKDEMGFESKMSKKVKESKINEEEGLTGNTGVGDGGNNGPGLTGVNGEAEKTEEPIAVEPVAEEPKKEIDKPTKEYLGNNGSSDYFYLVNVTGNDGTVTELQVTDAEEKVIYTTKDSQMDVNDVAGFINAAIKAKEIANISTDILTKYLMPEEKPEAEVAQEEEDKQAVPEEKPQMESLMKKYKLDRNSELMEKYQLNKCLTHDVLH